MTYTELQQRRKRIEAELDERRQRHSHEYHSEGRIQRSSDLVECIRALLDDAIPLPNPWPLSGSAATKYYAGYDRALSIAEKELGL